MDNKTYLLAQEQLLETISLRVNHLKRIASEPNGNENAYDFAVAEFYSHLNDIVEFSISSPGFTALTDFTPHGLMRNLCDRTAKVMRAPYAHIGFGGSSLSMLMTVGKILPEWIDKKSGSVVLVDPLCHQSVLGGLDIGKWQAVKLHRDYVSSLGLAAPLKLETVEAAVKANGSRKVAALVYNPISYDGFRNLEEEKKVFSFCEERNIKVIGDFAWSPFYGFEGFDEQPGTLLDNCHLCITSPHKKGMFPSPASVVLYRDYSLRRMFIEAGRLGWATTSPHYGTLMLIDYRLVLIEKGAVSERLTKISNSSKYLRENIGQLSDDIMVVEPCQVEATYQDPSHLILSSHQSRVDCRDLAYWLKQNACLDLEKSTAQTALFLVGSSHIPKCSEIISIFSEAITSIKLSGATK